MSYHTNYTEEIDADNALHYVSLDVNDPYSQQFVITAPKTATQAEIDAAIDVLIAERKEIEDSIAAEKVAEEYAANYTEE